MYIEKSVLDQCLMRNRYIRTSTREREKKRVLSIYVNEIMLTFERIKRDPIMVVLPFVLFILTRVSFLQQRRYIVIPTILNEIQSIDHSRNKLFSFVFLGSHAESNLYHSPESISWT